MSQAWIRYAVAGAILTWMTGVSRAQLPPSHDAWLMQNYHRTGPPPASELIPADPVLTELKEIQSTVRTILRRAKSEGDYESALAAAAQAVSNAQLIGAVIDHQRAAQSP